MIILLTNDYKLLKHNNLNIYNQFSWIKQNYSIKRMIVN